jgi:hypothetical protein
MLLMPYKWVFKVISLNFIELKWSQKTIQRSQKKLSKEITKNRHIMELFMDKSLIKSITNL